jgi:hypothetical protein
MRNRRFVSALIVATSASVACGSAAKTTHTPPTPVNDVVKTVAFWVRMPPGWSDATANNSVVAAVHPDGTLLLLLQGPEPTPAVSGLNDITPVIVVTAPHQLTSAQVPAYLQSVRTAGASDISSPAPTTVARSDATFVTYQSMQGATPVQTKDVVVAHGGAMYEIQLISSRYAFAQESQIFDQVLNRDWVWVTAD